ncbi:MAG: PKD domain-containing protein [Myxococcales bacterium]|nr:PKD domain-containing protein [Myxococcales bacterium]
MPHLSCSLLPFACTRKPGARATMRRGLAAGVAFCAGTFWLAACAVQPPVAAGAATDAADAAKDDLGTTELSKPDVSKRPADFAVQIEASALAGNAPLEVTFTAKVTGIPIEEAYFTWNFGDGSPDQEFEDGVVGHKVKWSFTSKGQYEVRVLVNWKKLLQKSKAEANVIVDVKNPASLSVDSKHPPAIVSALTVAPGDDVTLTTTVINEGDAIEVPFETAVYLSTDPSMDKDGDGKLDEGVHLVHSIVHKGMPSGQGVASTFAYDWDPDKKTGDPIRFKFPTNLEENVPYFVIVRTDAKHMVNELDRGDNEALALDFLTQNTKVAAKADLAMAAPSGFDAGQEYSPGDPLNFKTSASNLGEGVAKSAKFAVFLSKDDKVQYDFKLTDVCDEKGKNCQENPKQIDKMLTELGNSTLQEFGPKSSVPIIRAVTVPPIPDGTYHLIAWIDVFDTVGETDETNNVSASPGAIIVKKTTKQGMDVGLLSMTVKPKAVALGGSVGIEYAVKNTGTLPSPDKFPVAIYFCQDKAFSKPNCIVNQTNFQLAALAAGQEASGVQAVTISPLTPLKDSWYVYLQLDPDNIHVELDEGNNVGMFGPLKIVGQADVDLWPDAVAFHPDNVTAGDKFKVSYQIKNDGLSGAGACAIWIALTATGKCSVADINAGNAFLVHEAAFPGIDGGDVVFRTDVVTAPVGLDHTLTKFQVCVLVDPTGQQPKEKKPTNNIVATVKKLAVVGTKGGCFEDAYDDPAQNKDNDTAALAVPLPADPSLQFGSCGDEDWWKITVPKGFSLFMTLTSTPPLWTLPVPADLDLDLLGPDGKTVIDSNKLIAPVKQAAALTVTQSGEYLVRIYPHVGAAKAHYTLAATLVPPLAGVDLVGTGLVVGPPATYPGGLLKAKIKLTNLGDKGSGPFTLRYVLSKDKVIDAADAVLKNIALDKGVGAVESLDVAHTLLLPVVPGGTYWVGALLDATQVIGEVNEANNKVVSNAVQLSTAVTCTADAYSGNHTADDAATLATKSATYNALNVCPGLEDWYALDVPQGKTVSVKVGWKYQPGKGLIGVQLVDSSKLGVVAGAATPTNSVAKIPFVQTGGTYYAHVYVLPETGAAIPYDYDLEVIVAEPDPTDVCIEDPYEPNNGAGSSPEIGCGLASLSLCLGDEDWFHLAMTKGETLAFEFTHPASAFLLKVFSNPNLPALQTLTGNGKLTFNAPSDGTFHIQILYKSPGQKPAQGFGYTLKVDGGKGIDLTPKIKDVFPKQIVQGEDVYLTVGLSNECKDPAGPFWYGYWYSTDAKLDATDKLLLSRPLAGLAGKTKIDFDDKATLPIDAKPGPAYVFISADVSNVVAESQELNNADQTAVEVIQLCLTDALEPDGAPQVATPLPMGRSDDLSLCPYDLDWHVVSLIKGETLSVTIEFNQPTGDLDLRLYKVNKFGAPVAISATKQSPEKIVYTADESTKYYVRVNGFTGEANAYTMYACKKFGGVCFECVDDSTCFGFTACNVATTKCGPKPCQKLAECEDGNQCTLDECKTGLCSNAVQPDSACSDGNVCSLGETCNDKGSCETSDATAQFTLATPATGTDLGFDVTVTADGGYVLAGAKEVAKLGLHGWLDRRDKQGKSVWSKTFTDGEAPCELRAVVALPGGDELAAVGSCAVPGQGGVLGAWYLRVAVADGAVIASKVTGVGGLAAGLRDVVALEGGLVAVAGFAADAGKPSAGQEGWLAVMDGDGNPLWVLYVGGNGTDELTGVAALPGGQIFAVGTDAGTTGYGGLWLRTNVDGDVLAQGTLGVAAASGQSGFAAVHPGPGGLVFVAGHRGTKADGLANPEWQACLWKLALDGKVVAQTVVPATTPQASGFVGPKTSSAFDVAVRADGGAILVGWTGAVAEKTAGLDAVLWRLAPDGIVLGQWHAGQAKKDVLRGVAAWGGGWLSVGTVAEGDLNSDHLQVHVVPPDLECDDQNPCTADTCHPVAGCQAKPVPDGTACGGSKACGAGSCK